MERGDSTPGRDASSSQELHTHMALLNCDTNSQEASGIMNTPIFTESVRKSACDVATDQPNQQKPFSQYGLFAANISQLVAGSTSNAKSNTEKDPRIFYNITAPVSTFICGSQGSGKSHTLGVLLENCLVPCPANILPRPLTGIVFHYDAFSSESGGSPCEAAYLSSHEEVNVRVLCAPTNIGNIKRIYSGLPRVKVDELRINQADLNTERMLDLMAVSSIQGGGMPLYLHVVTRILRDLRILQQQTGSIFDYGAFKRALKNENLSDGQLAPLEQRLETLESFMVKKEAMSYDMFKANKAKNRTKIPQSASKGTSWTPVAQQLTIVDLSCPCVTADMACSLFNICLSLFLEQETNVGRVIALDEAHKYMVDSLESRTLTDSLLSAIRQQRHIAARVLISTQEPTISPKLLDLCNMTIVHRFTSPDWLKTLARHLAGTSIGVTNDLGEDEDIKNGNVAPHLSIPSTDFLFSKIVALRPGEAFVFAPSAIIGMKNVDEGQSGDDSTTEESMPEAEFVHLGNGVLKVRVRMRVTADGGRSIMAH
ncbi:hypothetical protein G7046_g7520 [Stylonectria norvegica]|nr:hypothetical protein G7046_g7520 [Stylonectria norvegica]